MDWAVCAQGEVEQKRGNGRKRESLGCTVSTELQSSMYCTYRAPLYSTVSRLTFIIDSIPPPADLGIPVAPHVPHSWLRALHRALPTSAVHHPVSDGWPRRLQMRGH